MALEVVALADRPDLADALDPLATLWPRFMLHDPTADLYYDRCIDAFPDMVFAVEHPDDPGRVVGRGYAVPFVLTDDRLPDDGWDAAIRSGIAALVDGRPATHVSALEIAIVPGFRGAGLAEAFLAAMRRGAAARGAALLVAPVRPTGTARQPAEAFATYAHRRRADGLPADPWLRTHVRAGGTIDRIAPRSMTISGSLDEWRSWTGEPFDRSGAYELERGLAPVIVDVDRDLGVYVEPNVWVRHPLDRDG